MTFEYTHAFVTPVFVSKQAIYAGVYRYHPDYEHRNVHQVARDALDSAFPEMWAAFDFGDFTLVAQAGTAESGERCIRIGFTEDFDWLDEAGREELQRLVDR